MAENEKGEMPRRKNVFRVTKFSRRQVLKSAGLLALGTAIGSVSLSAACKTTKATTGATNSSPDPTSKLPATTGVTSSSSTPPASSPPNSPTASTAATTAAGSLYTPPTVAPAVISITGTTCTVATDRLYSENNVWVKAISANTAVIGVSTTMVDLLGDPYSLSLSPVGTVLNSDDDFGSIEGNKMSVDLICPVSGTVMQVNTYLTLNQGGMLTSELTSDPYNGGWMLLLQLTRAAELNSLLTPQNYAAVVAKK